MKTYLLLLLAFISINCYSQHTISYNPYQKGSSWNTGPKAGTVIALFTTSIALNAIGDGLNNNNKKTAGHIYNALSIGTLLALPLLTDVNKDKWYIYLLSYTLIRMSIFDPIYNQTRELDINYIGNTSITDKFWRQWPNGPGLFGRSVFMTVGVSLPLNEL